MLAPKCHQGAVQHIHGYLGEVYVPVHGQGEFVLAWTGGGGDGRGWQEGGTAAIWAVEISLRDRSGQEGE